MCGLRDEFQLAKIIEFMKRILVAQNGIILEQDQAICLRIISKTLPTPKRQLKIENSKRTTT